MTAIMLFIKMHSNEMTATMLLCVCVCAQCGPRSGTKVCVRSRPSRRYCYSKSTCALSCTILLYSTVTVSLRWVCAVPPTECAGCSFTAALFCVCLRPLYQMPSRFAFQYKVPVQYSGNVVHYADLLTSSSSLSLLSLLIAWLIINLTFCTFCLSLLLSIFVGICAAVS